jgi:hypothetical protein
MAPHMGHYKWYQFYKYIWDAIKIACFWIGFVIIMVVYTLYWLIDFIIIEPIVSCVKCCIYLVEITLFHDNFDSEFSNSNQDIQGYSDGEKVVNPSLSFSEVNSLNSDPDSDLDAKAQALYWYYKWHEYINQCLSNYYNNTTNSTGV